MSNPASLDHNLKKGDHVAYYIRRNISTGLQSTCSESIRRTGIVQGWRNGKVIVLHSAGYTEAVSDADLYLVE